MNKCINCKNYYWLAELKKKIAEEKAEHEARERAEKNNEK